MTELGYLWQKYLEIILCVNVNYHRRWVLWIGELPVLVWSIHIIIILAIPNCL